LEYAEELKQAEERRLQDEIYKQKQLELQKRRLEMALEGKSKPAYSGGKLEKVAVVGGEEKYRELLRGLWQHGRASESDSGLLSQAREELQISDEDHIRLEKEIKLECYVAAIKNAWRSKKIIPTQPAAFEEFRLQFDVSVEEHTQVEGRLLWELQGQQKKEMIMYIDDDVGLTEVIDETLKDAGYKTLIATSPEQALQHLKNLIPDMIICDVRFPNSNMNGLMIYEEVRKMPALFAIPFVFLSGVSDTHIMYAGLTSGADDYITKPFNPDRLLAVIEGKLKRYKELRGYRA
jgi:CheY-like chemotaxis protein